MKKISLVGLWLIVALVVGCNEAAGPSATPAPDPDEAALVYEFSGGITGEMERWVIYNGGRVTLNDEREWSIDDDTVAQIVELITSLGFFEMKAAYPNDDPCCDRFQHTLTVTNGERTQTVMYTDAAPNAPPEIGLILEAVNELIGGLRSRQ